MKSDLVIWLNNPIIGVGLGLARKHRNHDLGNGYIAGAKSHTEYTRFLAEQGILGFFCIFILFKICKSRLITKNYGEFKILILFLIMFPALYFLPSAFSTFLPAYSLGAALLKPEIQIRM